MSLLLKALQKAAQSRETPEQEAVAAQQGKMSLQPLEKPKPAAFEFTTPAQAASVLQAGEREATLLEKMRERPVAMFAIAAAIFLAGYAVYVYIEINRPNLLASNVELRTVPPPQPAAPQLIAAAPAPQAPAAEVKQGTAAERPAPETVRAPASRQAAPAAPAAPIVAAPQPARDRVMVNRSEDVPPTINPALAAAYDALQRGNFEQARDQYQKLLAVEPHNVDALLGLASIAAQENKSDLASRYYLQILEIQPRHALAQAGLLAIVGEADAVTAETKLRQLIAREPSAFVYFTLGNLLAAQSQWANAQQAYFHAHHLEPDNPDYAYNLAVGLENVGQAKIALTYYRHALALAQEKGGAHFDLTATQSRVRRLESAAE
ncbi:MAG: tetratricopeptide repeat protein [Pseudomonadota bacterium]